LKRKVGLKPKRAVDVVKGVCGESDMADRSRVTVQISTEGEPL
jgi:hypothetical protein